jgi:hypothetical protein
MRGLMNKNRFCAMAIIMTTIVLAIGVYSNEFNVFNNKDSLMASTKEYIHQFDEGKQFEPKYVTSANIGNRMIVVFNDDKYENYMGAVISERGITGLWRPEKAEYGAGPVIQSISTNENPGRNDIVYMAYYATNCPPEVKSYKIIGTIYSNEKKAYLPDNVIERKITESTFIHLYRQEGFAEIHLYDEHGMELPRDNYLQFNQDCPNPVMGSEEAGFINIFSIAILVIGSIIASSFLIRRKGNDIT